MMEKRSKKSSSAAANSGGSGSYYKLLDQKLCITSINFQRRALMGSTTLHISLLRDDIKKIKINCQQSRICKLTVNGKESSFQYQDPSLDLTQRYPKSRNLEFLTQCHITAVETVDPHRGKGELTIDIPSDVLKSLRDDNSSTVKICLHFTLEDPQGGVHFVCHGDGGSEMDHLFTASHENSARLWFPCIDTYTQPCTWSLEFTVDEKMTAVSCGDLKETVYTTHDRKRKTFYYTLDIPTSAPNICLAVGCFEILVDPCMHEVTHFCLPQLKPLLEHTTSTLHSVFEFLEELLSFRFPYTCYKQVFVYKSYCDAMAYSSVGIFDTSLLHTKIILDQAPKSRQRMAKVLTEQLFGCFMVRESWNDFWVVAGISGYLYGLWLKSTFGKSEYLHWVWQEMTELCQYELETGALVLHYNKEGTSSNRYFPHHSPHTVPQCHYEMLKRKAHLILRKIESRIGVQLLLQALNKLLMLASNASSMKMSKTTSTGMMLSTASFMKSIYTVSGKDLTSIVNGWVTCGGVVCIDSSFIFNRKRNTVELEVKQSLNQPGAIQYVGPLTVRLQELDGTFHHTIQIEENIIKHDIPCHSKSRRNKKKKIPLLNGDEADIDLSAMDPDSPVLWIRVDPDLNVMRKVDHSQPDYMWQYQAKFERDVVGQLEAIKTLKEYQTQATSTTLMDIIENEQYFYKVRIEACDCLYQVFNRMQNSWTGPAKMIAIFTHFFCCETTPPIIRLNNFTNLQHYFLQKSLLLSMSKLRDGHGAAPKEIVNFILEIIKLNDNSQNRYADNYYRSTLVECLSNMITSPVTLTSERMFALEDLSPEVKSILEEIVRFLNLEKRLPSYHLTVTVSCLHALRKLQQLGHLRPDPELFKTYTRPGYFQAVRIAAIECLVDLLKTSYDWPLLQWLLEHVRKDSMPRVRMGVLDALIKNPPFRKEAKSMLNKAEFVEELWNLINKETCHDAKLRCKSIKLFHLLFGNSRPQCLPAPQYGFVVNLKEKRTHINPTIKLEPKIPMLQPRHRVMDEKRHRMPVPQPQPIIHDHESSKLRMKIKFSSSNVNTDDVLAAQSLLSLSNADVPSRPSTPGQFQSSRPQKSSSMANDSQPSRYHPQLPPSSMGGNPPANQNLQLSHKKKKRKHKHHKHKSSKHQRTNESDYSASPATPSSSVNSPLFNLSSSP